MLLALEVEEGARGQGVQQPLDTGKGKETGSPREPSESTQAHRHLDLGSARLILDVRFLGL